MDDLKNDHQDPEDGWKEIATAYRNDIRRFFNNEDGPTLDSIDEFYKPLIQNKLDKIAQKYLFEKNDTVASESRLRFRPSQFQSRYQQLVLRWTMIRADYRKVLGVVKNNDSAEGADIHSDFCHLGSKFYDSKFCIIRII